MINGKFDTLERFYQVPQGNGAFFTIPVRYQNVAPFQIENVFVCQAYDVVIQRPVVIKKVVLPETFDDHSRRLWKRAQRELYCMLHIEHENVVKLYSTFTPSQNVQEMTEFYIVREYMEGTMKSLTPQILGNHDVVKSVFFDICKGIQYLHNMNISHRDLKPQNILVRKQGDVKLCDFGHANWEDPRADTPYFVQRYYRAPEIICETLDRNRVSVDIWSLGCILAELLTGRVLFPGRDYIDQMLQIVKFLGSPDPQFYHLMNDYAREYLLQQRTDQYPTPCDNQQQFPNEYFHGALGDNTSQCDLARDLLFRMLIINPDYRINIQAVLKHPYLADVWDDSGEMETPNPPRVLQDFFQFHGFVDPPMMKKEIFDKLKNFEMEFDIFHGAKN